MAKGTTKKRAPSSDESESENEYQVEAIVDKRMKGKRIQYLLKWKGYSDADNTWEDQNNMNCPDLIKEFEDNHKKKTPIKNRKTKKMKIDEDDNDKQEKESSMNQEKESSMNQENETNPIGENLSVIEPSKDEDQLSTKSRLHSTSKSESIPGGETQEFDESLIDNNQTNNDTSVELIPKTSPTKESLSNEILIDPPANLRLRITPNSNSPISLTLNDSDNNNNMNEKSTMDTSNTDVEISEIHNEDEEPVEKIEAVRNGLDGIYFRIKLNRQRESQWIAAKIANRKYPQAVIAFWENHVEFT